jgi:hypothetical protein
MSKKNPNNYRPDLDQCLWAFPFVAKVSLAVIVLVNTILDIKAEFQSVPLDIWRQPEVRGHIQQEMGKLDPKKH